MKRLIFMCLILLSSVANAKEFKLLDVDEVSVDLYKVTHYSDPYWEPYDQTISKGATLNLNLSAVKYVFWEGQIQMLGNDSQLRYGGLQFRTGIHLGHYIDAFYMHHSEHIFDDGPVNPNWKFPDLDAVGVRFYFLRK